jgi:hypothetical protein
MRNKEKYFVIDADMGRSVIYPMRPILLSKDVGMLLPIADRYDFYKRLNPPPSASQSV